MLITVPAFKSLWSSEDVSAGHFRRYRKRQLADMLTEAGFEIVYQNYFMQFLYLPIFVVRVWMEKLGLLKRTEERSQADMERIAKKQFKTKNKLVECGLHFFETIEKRFLEKSNKVWFGSSLLVVAKNK